LEKSPCVDFLVFSTIKLSLDKGRENMKKILTVSLCSMLAVCAANADIASVEYVDGVTSNIQTQLNAKQAKLNYTAENTANKVTSVTSTSTDTQYPSAKAMYTALAGKQASLGYTAENTANKTQTIDANSTATQYPSAKAVKTALDFKVNINQGTDNAGKGLVVDRTTGNLTLTDIATQTELNSVSTSAATNALAALDYYSQDDNAVGGNLVGEGGKYIVAVKQEDGAVSILTKDYVNVITAGTMVAPTSNAVYEALALKQNSLGYTAENAANKVTSVTSTSSDTQYPSAKAVYTALSGKQASLGYTAENAANKVTSVSSTSTDTQYPSAKAMYSALSGKLSTTGTAAKATADASGNTITTTYATKTELETGLSGKLGTSLGSTAASKAVITDASGNITTGTISSAMITDATIATGDIANSAVTSAKIANNAVSGAKIVDGTITNADISASAAIEQTKISGLTDSLAGKQDAAPRDQSGNSYFVATSEGVWKDMFNSMPKDRNCEQEGVKCALTHKSGAYAWEIVRE
jgi:hypothetical protein